MALASGRSPRLSVRGLFQATTYSIMVLAALALFGTAGVPAPAAAQVKAPAKSKMKPAAPNPAAKADPTDNVALSLIHI